MTWQHQRSTRSDTLFPYAALFRFGRLDGMTSPEAKTICGMGALGNMFASHGPPFVAKRVDRQGSFRQIRRLLMRDPMDGWPSGQWQQTVNLPGFPYVGSNPTPSTTPFHRHSSGSTTKTLPVRLVDCTAVLIAAL